MYGLAAGEELDEDKARALVKDALKSEGHRQITAMVALARWEPGIPVTTDQLDHDRWLLVVKNGTLNLRTGKLGPHRRTDLITKPLPLEYHAVAACPTWEAFLERVKAGWY